MSRLGQSQRWLPPDNELAVDILSEALLSIIIKNPSIFKDELVKINLDLIDPRVSGVVTVLSKLDLENFNFAEVVKGFDGAAAMKLEFAFLRSQELWKDFQDEDLRIEFKSVLQKIVHRSIVARLVNLEYEMKEAEMTGDKDKISELISKFTNLTKELVEINNI